MILDWNISLKLNTHSGIPEISKIIIYTVSY